MDDSIELLDYFIPVGRSRSELKSIADALAKHYVVEGCDASVISKHLSNLLIKATLPRNVGSNNFLKEEIQQHVKARHMTNVIAESELSFSIMKREIALRVDAALVKKLNWIISEKNRDATKSAKFLLHHFSWSQIQDFLNYSFGLFIKVGIKRSAFSGRTFLDKFKRKKPTIPEEAPQRPIPTYSNLPIGRSST